MFKSIKFKIWLSIASLLVFIIALMYILQIMSFPAYYEYMKTAEIRKAVDTIEENWYQDNIKEVVSDLAKEKKFYVQIVFTALPSLSFTINEIGEVSTDTLSKAILQLKGDILTSQEGYIMRALESKEINQKALLYGTVIAKGTDDEAFIFIYNYIQPMGTTTKILESQFFVVTSFIILLSIAISVFISMHISKPIIGINKAAKQLPQGKFNVKIPKGEYLEISELAKTLESAAKEIEKSDIIRKELLSNISHDLRTPLTMIKAYAEMIRDLSGNNPEKREKHLAVIIDETNRLSSLVNDILDLSRLESGSEHFDPTIIDFSKELAEILKRFEILTNNYDFEIEIEENLFIYADKVKIGQVIYNLINNSITYTGQDKKIFVRLYSESGYARFEAQDTGEGIPKEDLPFIWERYYKVQKNGDTHKMGKVGTGLGLSIVKNVLELHHFRYGVKSAVGKGSLFWFEAPIAQLKENSFATEDN